MYYLDSYESPTEVPKPYIHGCMIRFGSKCGADTIPDSLHCGVDSKEEVVLRILMCDIKVVNRGIEKSFHFQ
jgi:hypothetical protein